MKTLGEFCREKVLSLPEEARVERHVPFCRAPIRIEKGLFGWQLWSGKNRVECRSEEEARYLRVCLDAGMVSIWVPTEDAYLASILPEMEHLKTKIDEIIASYLDGILSRKTRERVRSEVFAELTK